MRVHSRRPSDDEFSTLFSENSKKKRKNKKEPSDREIRPLEGSRSFVFVERSRSEIRGVSIASHVARATYFNRTYEAAFRSSIENLRNEETRSGVLLVYPSSLVILESHRRGQFDRLVVSLSVRTGALSTNASHLLTTFFRLRNWRGRPPCARITWIRPRRVHPREVFFAIRPRKSTIHELASFARSSGSRSCLQQLETRRESDADQTNNG